MRYVLLAMVFLLGCATPYERCRDGLAERYGGMDACVSSLNEENRQMVESLQQDVDKMNQSGNRIMAEQPQDNHIKRTDFNCLNQCLARGYMYGLCESKCSY